MNLSEKALVEYVEALENDLIVGREKFNGTEIEVVFIDEEPPEKIDEILDRAKTCDDVKNMTCFSSKFTRAEIFLTIAGKPEE